jgi:hypothetical protein
VLIFQPTENSRASDKQRRVASETASLTESIEQLLLSTHKSGFWRGLGGGGGPFWLQRETLTFQGSCSIPNIVVFQIGVNKIPPKFKILFATS